MLPDRALAKANEAYKNKLNAMYNPDGDGNCGFRAIAIAIKGTEDDWKDVKQEMLDHLLEKEESFYSKRWLSAIIESTKKILLHRESTFNTEYWYTEPECSHLACNTYNIPIAIYMNSRWGVQKMFFVPVFNPIETMAPIILQDDGAHIHYATLKPRIHMKWPKPYSGYFGDIRLTGVEDASIIYDFEERGKVVDNIEID